MITEPGVYDLTDAEYHADPVQGGSLSSTGARKLLSPSCPAKFKWLRDNGELHTAAFDHGKAAHRKILGVGPEIVPVQAKDWRTKKAQDARAEAHEAGMVPLLVKDVEIVDAMADALRADPIAGNLFAPGTGEPEVSLVWKDRRTNLMRRARLDWLRQQQLGRPRIVVDYKTCASAEPSEIEKTIQKFGYHQQGEWYLDGVYELGLASGSLGAAFVFVFQEKNPPYVVTASQLHPDTLLVGRTLNDYAIDVYNRCTATGVWPGYTTEIILSRIPAYAEIQFERARDRGDYQLKESA